MSPLSANEIAQLLPNRFRPPEWVLLFQVASRTGFAPRHADALALNMYESRGQEVHGIEIKASRGDWLRELKNPEKSIEVQQFCDRWWIVVAQGVVNLDTDEIPATWGVLEAKKGRLYTIVKAPKLKAKQPDRAFLAAVLRRVHEGYIHRDEIQNEIKEAFKRGKDSRQYEIERIGENAKRLHKFAAEFHEHAGIELLYLKAETLAHGYKLVSQDYHYIRSGIAADINRVERAKEHLQKVLMLFEKQGGEKEVRR